MTIHSKFLVSSHDSSGSTGLQTSLCLGYRTDKVGFCLGTQNILSLKILRKGADEWIVFILLFLL